MGHPHSMEPLLGGDGETWRHVDDVEERSGNLQITLLRAIPTMKCHAFWHMYLAYLPTFFLAFYLV